MTFSTVHPFWLHESQGLTAVAVARHRSLVEGKIAHPFHYASARQSELWLAVHQAFSPVVGQPDVETAYREFSREFAARLRGTKEVHVIGLGAGGARKDRWLLEALRAEKIAVRFTPLEVSPTLGLLSAQHTAEVVDFPITPLVADLLLFPDLPAWLTQLDGGSPRLYTCYGLLPNFHPEELFPLLHGWLRAQDSVALSANLVPGPFAAGLEQIRPQYDNPLTENWLTRVLTDWGLERETSDYRLEVSPVGHEQAQFLASVAWENHKRLQLFFSYRYSPRSVAALFKHYGFENRLEKIAPGGEEGVWGLGK